MSDYNLTADTTPTSTFKRPTTPVPHWPLPTLKSGNVRPTTPSITPRKDARPRPMTPSNPPRKGVRPSASKASLSKRDIQPRSPRMTSIMYSSEMGPFPSTPPLPPAWTVVHDRAICVLDACDYSLPATIKKLRSAFPELAGSVLTPIMVDKRLRTLDQNYDIDFFRIGLEHLLLTRDERGDALQVTRAKREDRGVRAVHEDTTASMPSFSSLSSGRLNSVSECLPGLPFKV